MQRPAPPADVAASRRSRRRRPAWIPPHGWTRLTDQTGKDGLDHATVKRDDRRFIPRIAPFVVALALASALASFAVFTGYTPVAPTDAVVVDVFLADGIIALVLFALVAAEAWKLLAAWRARQAGARLHAYIVGLFSITAAVPAVIMAVVGAVALGARPLSRLRRRCRRLHRGNHGGRQAHPLEAVRLAAARRRPDGARPVQGRGSATATGTSSRTSSTHASSRSDSPPR